MDARYDLGNMVQAVYNTAHGHFLEITTGDLEPRQMSRLGSHVDPILGAVRAPARVAEPGDAARRAQAAIVATGAWPAYSVGHAPPATRRAGRLAGATAIRHSGSSSSTSSTWSPSRRRPAAGRSCTPDEDRWVSAGVLPRPRRPARRPSPGDRLPWALLRAPQALAWLLVVTVLGVACSPSPVGRILHYNGDQSPSSPVQGTTGTARGGQNALLHPGRRCRGPLGSNLRYLLALLWPLGSHLAAQPADGAHACRVRANALSATVFQRRIEFHYTALSIPFLLAAPCSASCACGAELGRRLPQNEKLMKGERVQRSAALLVPAVRAGGQLSPGRSPLPAGAATTVRRHAKTSHDAALTRPWR
jgi:hypothetical protein